MPFVSKLFFLAASYCPPSSAIQLLDFFLHGLWFEACFGFQWLLKCNYLVRLWLLVQVACPFLFVHPFSLLVLLPNGDNLAMMVQLFWWSRLVFVFRSRIFGLGIVMGSIGGLFPCFTFIVGCNITLGFWIVLELTSLCISVLYF